MDNDNYGWAFMFEVMVIVAGGYLAHKMALLEKNEETHDDIIGQIRELEHEIEAVQKRHDEALEKERFLLKMQKIIKKMNSSALENGHEEDANTD